MHRFLIALPFVVGLFAAESAVSLNNLGEALRAQGRYEEAEPPLQRSLAMTLDQLGPWHVNVAVVKLNLAKVYLHQGQLDRAEALLLQAAKIYEKANGPDGPALAGVVGRLAMVHLRRNELVRAESLARRNLAIQRRAEQELGVASALNTLGMVLHAARRFGKAEESFRESLRILASTTERDEAARVLGNLSRLLRDRQVQTINMQQTSEKQ